MDAQAFTIRNRSRKSASQVADVSDFDLGEASHIVANSVLEPHISLYCLDDSNKQAIFVDLPVEMKLASAPFVYQQQLDHAKRVISVSYDDFKHLASKLPGPQNVHFLYSTGRCGSTLLHQVFNRLGGVISLSEADVLSQFIHLRQADGSRDQELICYMTACAFCTNL